MRVVRPATVLAVLLALPAVASACTSDSPSAQMGLHREGQLSVCVPLPRPMYAQTGEDQQVTGLDADVLAKITETIELTPHYVIIPEDWVGTNRPFTEGQCEIVAGGLIVDAADRDVVDYSQPYLRTHAAVLVRSDSEITDAADLDGETVATPGDRPWAGMISAYSTTMMLTHAAQPDMVSAIAALDAGDVPAVLGDDASLRYLANSQPDKYRLVEGVTEPAFPIAFAMSVKVESDLRDALNGAIRDLDEDGTLAATARTWTGL